MLFANILSALVPPIYEATERAVMQTLTMLHLYEKPAPPKIRQHVVYERIQHHKNPRTGLGVEIRGVMAHLWSHRIAVEIHRALRDGVDFELHVVFNDWGYHETFEFKLDRITELAQRAIEVMFRDDPNYTDALDELATHEVHTLVYERGVKDKPMERRVVIRVAAAEITSAA